MNKYKWHGINAEGRECRGTLYAHSPDELRAMLLQQHIIPLTLQQKKSIVNFKTISSLFPPKKVSSADLIFTFSSLSLLLQSGITLREALKSTQIQARSLPVIEALCKKAILEIEKGEMFSIILEKELIAHPFIAPLIAASERSGTLIQACLSITSYLEQRRALAKKIRSAATLPLLTLGAAFFMLIGMSVCIIPRFQMLYSSFDKELPAFTLSVFSCVRFLSSQFFLLASIVIFIFFIYLRRMPFPRARLYFSKTLNYLPIMRQLVRYQDQLYFFQTVSLLLKSGVPLLSALHFCKKIVSTAFSHTIEHIITLVSQGSFLHTSMEQFPAYFPPEHCALIALGEQSGTLETIMTTIEKQIQTNYNRYLELITKLFQPFLLLIVGGIIGTILMALYAPLLNLASLV